MSVDAINWVLAQRVGNGILKATLASIACLHDGGPVKKSDVAKETGLTPPTLARHFRLLKFLGFIKNHTHSVTMRISK